jgi:gamma-butyrobetaine dioxygenase
VVNRAEYPNAGKIYENIVPIIGLHPDGSFAQVMNNPSKMFFDTVAFDDMPRLYLAYRRFKDLLDQGPSYAHLWTEGDFVIWDNRRVLHGRGDFGSEGVQRILRGGYMRETELLARYRFAYAQEHPGQPVRGPVGETQAA